MPSWLKYVEKKITKLKAVPEQDLQEIWDLAQRLHLLYWSPFIRLLWQLSWSGYFLLISYLDLNFINFSWISFSLYDLSRVNNYFDLKVELFISHSTIVNVPMIIMQLKISLLDECLCFSFYSKILRNYISPPLMKTS